MPLFIKRIFTLRQKSFIYGISLMLGAIFFFICANVFIKTLATSFPIAEILFVRFVFFIALLTPMTFFGKNKITLRTLWSVPSKGLLLLRGLLAALSLWSIAYGVQNLPLGTVSVLLFSGIFFVNLLAIPILKEKISGSQWIALGLGFVGILIILRPSHTLFNLVHIASYVVLLGALMDAFVLISPKLLIKKMPMNTIIYCYALFAFPMVCILLFLQGWVPITSWGDAGCFLGQSVAALMGQLCITRAVTYAPAATLAPMIFSSILWSVLFGFLFWGEVPDGITILGSVVIIGAGFYVIHHENKKLTSLIDKSQSSHSGID